MRRPWSSVAGVAAVIALSGCIGDLIEIPTGPKTDGGTTADLAGAVDDSGPPLMPKFFPDIQGDIERLGCTAAACHGGSQVPNEISMPLTQTDKDNNYNGFKMRAMMGEMSLVLQKNLAGSGVVHTGGTAFASKADPTYQKWLAWINAGNPEQ
jgi:hypothetical protein